MNVTLTINGRDFAPRLSTYKVYKEVSYGKVITVLSGREIPCQKTVRQMIEFSVFPLDYTTFQADYAVLSQDTLTVSFTDPDDGTTETQSFRLVTDLDAVYGLLSVNGSDYYKRGAITLRAIYPEA